MKKILSVIVMVALLLTAACSAEVLLEMVPEPVMGNLGGDWVVIALARGGTEVPDGYYEGYLDSVEQGLIACGGMLHPVKYTEYSRTLLALAALGENPADFRGFDLVAPLTDVDTVKIQGNNGPIWALIALDSGDYEGVDEARTQLLQTVLAAQNKDGGYALLYGDASGADLTAMALTALAAHTDIQEVSDAVQRGVERLVSFRLESCESCAQALLAYASLGMKDEAAQVREMLEEYAVDGGYIHLQDEAEANGMATEQACYAIAAYEKMMNGQSNLFDMRDAK